MKKSLVILFAVLVAGCTKTVYLPKEVSHIEYRDRESVRVDSAYVRDSVFLAVRGDTVYLEKYRYRYLYRDRIIRDSVFKRDSIRVPYPVEVVREVRHVPRFFWWCFAAALAIVSAWIARLLR